MRNVKCDARRIFFRLPRHEVLFSNLEKGAATFTAADGNEQKTLEDLLPALRLPSPDQAAVAHELENKVRKSVKVLPNGEDCLDAMLEHEPPSDTAARLGVPVHTVLRTRANIRIRAQRVLV